MNTFLPYRSFWQSARCLDRLRLGKQRIEVLQILRTLTGSSEGWKNHPATCMWRGYEPALAEYGFEICREWTSRGYKDTCYGKIAEIVDPVAHAYPPWLGDDRLHASHRSNLLRKDPLHYKQFHWVEPDNLPYYWPVKRTEVVL
jgi:hypothetical protein